MKGVEFQSEKNRKDIQDKCWILFWNFYTNEFKPWNCVHNERTAGKKVVWMFRVNPHFKQTI